MVNLECLKIFTFNQHIGIRELHENWFLMLMNKVV